jgi:leader peptidase (prepilin peptidase) / N-methyltransferase
MTDVVFSTGDGTIARFDRAWTGLSRRQRDLATAGATASLAVALAAGSVVSIPSALALAAVGILAAAASIVDVAEHRLPNTLMALSMWAVLAAAVAGGLSTTGDVIVGLLIAALPLWIVRYGKGLALGDVKFAAVLGAAGGLIHPGVGLVAVWFAALASGIYGIVRNRSSVALGPWLWGGFIAGCGVGVIFVQMGAHAWPARF